MINGALIGLVLAGFATAHFNRNTYEGGGAYLKIGSAWVVAVAFCALIGRLAA